MSIAATLSWLSPEPDAQITAYHEAGHAITALALGFELIHLSIVPKEHERGHCAHQPGRGYMVPGYRLDRTDGTYRRRTPEEVEQWAQQVGLRARIAIYLAGEVAEEIAGGMNPPTYAGEVDFVLAFGSDMEGAQHAAQLLRPNGPPKAIDAELKRGASRAARLLYPRFEDVRRLAAVLLERYELGPADVKAVLRGGRS